MIRAAWASFSDAWNSPSAALQLRYLQTMNEIGTSERTTTLVLPFPVEMLKALGGVAEAMSADGRTGGA